MCNILNALKIGSWEIPWTMEEALFWNLIAQVCLLLAVVIVFIIVIRRMLKDVAPQKVEFPKEERTLMGITLDASMVQRDFKVGEEFACNGLLVIANYNLAPAGEVVTDFTVISQEMLKNGEALEALTECLVVAPDMSEPGKKVVNVSYRGQSASFVISVTEAEEVQPEPETPAEAAKEPVTVIAAAAPAPVKRTLVGISVDASLVRREFYVGDEFECEGLIVMAHFNTAPYTVQASKFRIAPPDMMNAGKKAVLVMVDKEYALYGINVMEEPAEETEEEAPAPVRELLSVSLDTTVVQREFTVGDEFNSDGLIVTANYSEEPLSEQVTDYEITPPDLSEAGKPIVTVRYGDKSAVYAVSVTAEAEPEPEEVRELVGITLDTGVVRRAFYVGDEFNSDGLIVTANYSMAPYTEQVIGFEVTAPDLSEEGKKTVTVTFEGQTAVYAVSVEPAPVEEEPEEEPAPERILMSITLNTDAVQKEFTAGDSLSHEGLIVTANYSEEPYTEEVTDYTVLAPDMAKEGKPTVTVAYQDMMAGYQIVINAAPEPEPVILPPVIVEEQPETIYVKPEPVIIEEESFEAGKLRYNRSFTARIIQSDDDIKHWYTQIKNELLSYKKAKARMSWKRENFRVGRMPFARFGFRGKTLCLFLPLNPLELEDTKYKVEDVSDNSGFAETPCMFRIKNDRRVKYAIELIGLVAAGFGAPRIEHESEDFYMPYEGVVELINKGLIKRSIKTKADEAIFAENRGAAEEPKPTDTEIAPGVIIRAVSENKLEKPETPTETPVETVAETVVETPAETPVEVTAETPAETMEMPVETVAEPTEEIPAETAEEVPAEVREEVPAPAEAEVAVTEAVEEPVDEPAPIVEEEPVDEPAPIVEEEPVDEPAPIVEEEPIDEPAPIVEEEPVEEPAPIVEEEPAPIVEEEPIDEPAPIVEEEPIDELAPIVEEEPVDEPAPIVEEEPVEEPAPIVEEEPVEEPAPIVEEEPVEEPAPIVEEEPVEEPAPIEDIFETTEEEATMSEDSDAESKEDEAEEDNKPGKTTFAKSSLSMRRRRNRHKHR